MQQDELAIIYISVLSKITTKRKEVIDMDNEIVLNRNNQAVTTSIKVAKYFGKRHDHILRDIENMKKDVPTFGEMFKLGSTKDSYGRQRKTYFMNQEGFTLLVFGFKGSKATQFKLEFFDAFKRMEKIIKENHLDSYMIEDPVKRAEKWLQEYKRTAKLEQENKVLKPKALFADSVSTSKDTILVRELAKLLKQNGIQIGEVRLFKWLRENGYLIKRKGSDYNTPTQKSMEMGLFRVKEFIHTDGIGTVKITKTPKVTGKGQQYFINKLTNQMKASEK